MPRFITLVSVSLIVVLGLTLLPAHADDPMDAPVFHEPVSEDDAAHAELIRYLRPLGASARWQEGALNVAAAVMLGLLLVGAIAVWIMVRRGMI